MNDEKRKSYYNKKALIALICSKEAFVNEKSAEEIIDYFNIEDTEDIHKLTLFNDDKEYLQYCLECDRVEQFWWSLIDIKKFIKHVNENIDGFYRCKNGVICIYDK